MRYTIIKKEAIKALEENIEELSAKSDKFKKLYGELLSEKDEFLTELEHLRKHKENCTILYKQYGGHCRKCPNAVVGEAPLTEKQAHAKRQTHSKA